LYPLEALDQLQITFRIYPAPTVLTVQAHLEFEWWLLALPTGLQESIAFKVAGNLGVAWGDGSGTGTGGTLEWVGPDSGPLPYLETWMGTWKPTIHRFSSNWREWALVATLNPTEQAHADF
jgi:hypothetical protein